MPRITDMKRIALGLIVAISLTACGQSAGRNLPTNTSTPKAIQNITIAFGGDTHGVAQISSYLDKGKDPFASVAPTLKSADISVVNLESSVTTLTEHKIKKYVFNSNPLLLDWMAQDGVDIVNLGNNHAGDYLRAGLSDTIKNLEAKNLKVIGAGTSGRDAWTAKVINVRGTKVAFLGIAKINSGGDVIASGEFAGTTNGWDPEVIQLAIKAAARQAKIVIIYTHWGVESQACPQQSDVDLAKQWLDWGATAIIGSHSHRQQPAVRYATKVVDYSLGNFVFYAQSPTGIQSGIGLLTVAPTGEVIKYQFKPALINVKTGTPKMLTGKAKIAAIAAKQSSCKTLSN